MAAAITHILFPFDFSVQGAQTVPFVKALASRLNASHAFGIIQRAPCPVLNV